MSNILPNGTVLPFGLINGNGGLEAAIAGFNRSYRNTGLKAGFVVKSYAADDVSNQSQLCTEYDVQTIEQFENKGTTSILYRNCLSYQGFGSIADFLEFTLRSQTYDGKNAPVFAGQDGAIVLIQCLDNIGSKAIVVGTLIHPDRPTTITGTAPQLSGEYNGVNVQIANDGSCTLTFKGATDSKGVPKDSSLNTTFQIKTDGSFEFMHPKVDILADAGGALTITANGDASITCDNANITASGDTNLKTTGTTTITSETIVLNKQMTGITTAQSHQQVIDFITGIPVMPSLTVFGDV